MEQQETKSLEAYIEEFGKLLESAAATRKAMCYNYTEAVNRFGLREAEKAYAARFPRLADVLPYMLLVGQGKAHVDVTIIGFESVRKRLVKLPIEEQNEFFEEGATVRDYDTQEKKHVESRMSQLDWQVLWDDGKNGFRTDSEQIDYIRNRSFKTAENRKRPWQLKKDGYVHIGKACKLKILVVVDILLKCIATYPELGDFIKIDLSKYQTAKKTFKPEK